MKVASVDMEQTECLLHGFCVEGILSYAACKVHGPYCIVICGLHHSLSTSSHKLYDFQSIVIGWKMCDFRVSVKLLSETFCVPRRIQRDMIRSELYIGLLHVKCCRLFLSDFNETWIFSTDFQEVLKYQNSWKFSQWQPSCSMWTDRQTDRHDKAYSFFWQSCESA
jgi:hypothetical protein